MAFEISDQEGTTHPPIPLRTLLELSSFPSPIKLCKRVCFHGGDGWQACTSPLGMSVILLQGAEGLITLMWLFVLRPLTCKAAWVHPMFYRLL